MDTILIPQFIVIILFFIVAFGYSSVGLGGGTSYTALLAIIGVSAIAIPIVTLFLNLIVTSLGAFNFISHKHDRWKMIMPFILSSIPMAYLGGSLHIPGKVFYWILIILLILVAVRIYLLEDTSFRLMIRVSRKVILSLLIGGILGFIAGVAGLGGGIFLVPLIIILGLGSEKEAAVCGTIFIWLNSMSGLISRIQFNYVDLLNFYPIIIAVIIGGAAGSYMGSVKFSPKTMRKILGSIVIVAIFLLFKKIISI